MQHSDSSKNQGNNEIRIRSKNIFNANSDSAADSVSEVVAATCSAAGTAGFSGAGAKPDARRNQP